MSDAIRMATAFVEPRMIPRTEPGERKNLAGTVCAASALARTPNLRYALRKPA